MWILPKQLHTSPYVLDMAELISDLNEQSLICEQSLLVRSKPTLARTWLRKWKKDSWTQHLSGRILKPSLGATFVERWTSCLADTLVSPSQPLESDLEKTTQDISGLILQMELDLCNLDYASLKTSKDTSPLDFEKLSKNWKASVIKQRGEYSRRQKLGQPTDVKECSSWPTPRAANPGSRPNGKGGKILEEEARKMWPTPIVGDSHLNSTPEAAQRRIAEGKATLSRVIQMWPSPIASEARQGFQDRTRNKKGTQESLTTVVINGLAVQKNHNTIGNPQESWATPQARDGQGGTNVGLWLDLKRSRALPNQMCFVNNKDNVKLNPRWVETLMGIPIGWTMPSCTNPLIIEQTNSGYLAMGLSQQLPH